MIAIGLLVLFIPRPHQPLVSQTFRRFWRLAFLGLIFLMSWERVSDDPKMLRHWLKSRSGTLISFASTACRGQFPPPLALLLYCETSFARSTGVLGVCGAEGISRLWVNAIQK